MNYSLDDLSVQAFILYEKGSYAKALELCRKHIEENPNDQFAMYVRRTIKLAMRGGFRITTNLQSQTHKRRRIRKMRS